MAHQRVLLEIMQHPGSSGSQTPCFSLISAHYSSIYIARRTPELESIPLPAINSIRSGKKKRMEDLKAFIYYLRFREWF